MAVLFDEVLRDAERTGSKYRDICRELEIPFECCNVGCMMPYMDYTPRTLDEIRNSMLNTQ